jgi:hypothetical protein
MPSDPGEFTLKAFLNGKLDYQSGSSGRFDPPIMKLRTNCHATNARGFSNEIAKLRELLNFASLIEWSWTLRKKMSMPTVLNFMSY